ncbi:hypothetical protein RclHR1_06540012 [Rhizophagus clarus]|uniref:Uncharacterized protein n=1 Tax=Rhizophagus clarus TaxID=94130 RepID=A0A2Z6SAA5_9GLOM|nr:hypothetical protein RclHR1_06540012 [Rhizophagus clarus]
MSVKNTLKRSDLFGNNHNKGCDAFIITTFTKSSACRDCNKEKFFYLFDYVAKLFYHSSFNFSPRRKKIILKIYIF